MHSPKWQVCAAPAVVTAPKIEYRCTNIGAYFDPVPRAQVQTQQLFPTNPLPLLLFFLSQRNRHSMLSMRKKLTTYPTILSVNAIRVSRAITDILISTMMNCRTLIAVTVVNDTAADILLANAPGIVNIMAFSAVLDCLYISHIVMKCTR
eukprot:scaffold82344_cov89-Cyclotella_meneghiniana.AAC.1